MNKITFRKVAAKQDSWHSFEFYRWILCVDGKRTEYCVGFGGIYYLKYRRVDGIMQKSYGLFTSLAKSKRRLVEIYNQQNV